MAVKLVSGEMLEAVWVPAEALQRLRLYKAQIKTKESLGRLAARMLTNALEKESSEKIAA